MDTFLASLYEILCLPYILACNAATYFLLTLVESASRKSLKTWHKRLWSAGVAAGLGVLFVLVFGYGLESIITGFFVQFIVYDYLLKPLIKRIQKIIQGSDIGGSADNL